MTAAVRVPTPGEGNGVEAFFSRCGLHPDARRDCLATVRRLFPTVVDWEEAKPQGYCSYTLCAAERGTVVQFRGAAHRIDPAVSVVAQEVYGDWAPRIEVLETLQVPLSRCLCTVEVDKGVNHASAPTDEGIALEDGVGSAGSFQVLSMSMTPGISLTELRAAPAARGNHVSMSQRVQRQRESLVVQFAHFIALGWRQRGPASDSQHVQRLGGRVGSSMRWRLEQMRALLPRRFRSEVQRVLDELDSIRALPWVLTHGDVVPANVMVTSRHDEEEDCVKITGFLDWAEAEYLPFGVGLYGLEELLGEVADGGMGPFQYYPETPRLRELFWSRLAIELENDGSRCGPARSPLGDVIESAHVLGVLLWHGIAFDDGRLDRVVDESRDREEVQRLDAFFASTGRALQVSDCNVFSENGSIMEDVHAGYMAPALDASA